MKSLSALTLMALLCTSRANEIEKFDPNMAIKDAVVTNGVMWIDGEKLPLEGKAFADTTRYYDRLTEKVTTNVNAGVRGMRSHSAGLQFRFKTSSKKLIFKWLPLNSGLAMHHMPATGMSGIDVYAQGADGVWRYVKTGLIYDAVKGGKLEIPWTPGAPCLVNLPLYNGVKSFTLGIETNATIAALPPRASGISRPVVFYGTSITHGGCASRPGLAFVNIVGRKLDVPVVNLGFSGSGKMELEMSEHLARIDASCYVLDCLWNMRSSGMVKERYEPFIRNLRALRANVPILMAERYEFTNASPDENDVFIRKLYEKLIAEGWKNLYYLPKTGMMPADAEGTVDAVHPNDLGMMTLADGFGKALRDVLKLKR